MPENAKSFQMQKNPNINSYLENQILSMNPMQLLIKVYDAAILGCKAGDSVKASKALVELVSALRFEYEEISLGLFRLYQFCMDEVKQGKFDIPLKILIELRKTWVSIAKQSPSLKREEIEVG